jgi:glycogen(starch) synthase
LVATVHATEVGRHQGWLPNELSRDIFSVEWWLANNSSRVIACSHSMKRETVALFGVPERRVAVVPNGIDLTEWRTTDRARRAARERYAPDGPLLVHTGRLEWEKGLHTLLDAMPRLRRALPGVRLVVAGRGSKEFDLHQQAKRLHLGDDVAFVGWLPEDDLHALLAAADAAIVPSLYEPFGLVALEAAALGAPAVVADSGGLGEFADDGRVALTFPPGDPIGLADAVVATCAQPDATRRRVDAASQAVQRDYTWARVAEMTHAVYLDAAASFRATGPLRATAPEPPAAGTQVLTPPLR